ncbi:hypothetical protein FOA52_012399 [Chlamydomonas sp. UWO 241]|nr:hypothetical protein FOA52_012399 [Chlamydomonas sp. UWO 241]
MPESGGEQPKQRSSSCYINVTWDKASSSWCVQLRDRQTKCSVHIANFASEEDAARAYERAAVQAHGPGASKRNLPGEAVGELPVALGEEREQRRSSRYTGVGWHTAKSAWQVQLMDPQTERLRFIGNYASEEDAARAYDYSAAQARGPGAKRNFPGEVITKPPASLGEEREQMKSSRYIGVYWDKRKSAWRVRLHDPHTKRPGHIGWLASDREEDAARAHGCAAVRMHGPGALRNFPAEAMSEPPVTVGVAHSSRLIGVAWYKPSCSWRAQLQDPQTKHKQHIGCYASEEDAARAYDREAVRVLGPGAKCNFSDEGVSSEPQGGKRTRLWFA